MDMDVKTYSSYKLSLSEIIDLTKNWIHDVHYLSRDKKIDTSNIWKYVNIFLVKPELSKAQKFLRIKEEDISLIPVHEQLLPKYNNNRVELAFDYLVAYYNYFDMESIIQDFLETSNDLEIELFVEHIYLF